MDMYLKTYQGVLAITLSEPFVHPIGNTILCGGRVGHRYVSLNARGLILIVLAASG
jgi:hypothetical protein